MRLGEGALTLTRDFYLTIMGAVPILGGHNFLFSKRRNMRFLIPKLNNRRITIVEVDPVNVKSDLLNNKVYSCRFFD
jgi:hypothetical protein